MTNVPDTASGSRGGMVRPGGVFSPDRRLLTSGLVLIVTLVAFESMSVATVMPVVEADLGDLALYGWVFSAFFLGTLVGVVIAGTAADRMRPAIPFAAGLVIFALGLVAGGMAPTMIVLVLGRFLQGVGAGAMPATSYVCIGRTYPLEQRPQMFALISSAWMLPSVIGPVIAAWIAETVGWRWVFLGLLPLTAVIGIVAVIGVKSVPAPDEPSGERNVLNAVLVAAGAGLLLVGLGSRSLIVFIPVTLIGAVVMVRPFMRLTPVGTLRARSGLPATVAVRGLLNFGFYAADAFVPFAITTVRGMSPIYGGLAMTTASLTWTISSWLQTRWIRTRGATILVVAGLAIIGLGTAGMVTVLIPAIPGWVGLLAWGVAGFGMGLAFSPLAHVAMELADKGKEGKATTALQLSDTLGAALGIGVAGVLVSTVGALTDSEVTGLVLTFGMATFVALLGAVLGTRVPRGSELG
ncbi:MAG: MFS transporter [Actinobacteria bacterium]|nr:MFS transporter [Actinomycetota bacterium]